MQPISSRLTFLHKFILPPLFAVGSIYYLLWADFRHIRPGSESYYFPILMVAYLIFWIWMGWGLKKVSVFGGRLWVSNYRREISIPFSDIAEVSGNVWTRPQRVTVRLRVPSEFGPKIVFLAKYRYFINWSEHPIVNDLRTMARSESSTYYLNPPPSTF